MATPWSNSIPTNRSRSNNYRLALATFHRTYNNGACLQAFYLSQHLKATILDHNYPGRLNFYGPATTEKKMACVHFSNSLPLTSWRVDSEKIEPTIERINADFDAVVVGSDETLRTPYGLVSQFVVPPPSLYYLDDRIKVPKFYYAASVGSSRWKNMSATERELIYRILDDFVLIGVRDEITWDYVEMLGSSLRPKLEMVPDPVFLCEATYSKKDTVYRDEERLGPWQWMKAVMEAKYCVTERMHALICTLLGNTPCLSLDRRQKSLELVREFRVEEWDYDFISRKIFNIRRRHHEFANKLLSSI